MVEGRAKIVEYVAKLCRSTVPSSKQECCAGYKQKYSTQLIHRNVAQIASRNMVPSWYARMLHGLQAGVWSQCKGACRNIAKSQKGIERGSEGFIEQLVKHREGQHL